MWKMVKVVALEGEAVVGAIWYDDECCLLSGHPLLQRSVEQTLEFLRDPGFLWDLRGGMVRNTIFHVAPLLSAER